MVGSIHSLMLVCCYLLDLLAARCIIWRQNQCNKLTDLSKACMGGRIERYSDRSLAWKIDRSTLTAREVGGAEADRLDNILGALLLLSEEEGGWWILQLLLYPSDLNGHCHGSRGGSIHSILGKTLDRTADPRLLFDMNQLTIRLVLMERFNEPSDRPVPRPSICPTKHHQNVNRYDHWFDLPSWKLGACRLNPHWMNWKTTRIPYTHQASQ